MIIILKEICILGEWQFLGVQYIKDAILAWPILTRYGRLYENSPTSSQTKMHLKFHQPEKVRQFNGESIILVRDHLPGFDRLVGYWPWDDPTVLRFPADMDELYAKYGISDIRMYCYRE